MSYVKLGPEEGAKLYYGGERIGTEGYFMEPTIFTEVKPNMKIYQEEICTFIPSSSPWHHVTPTNASAL